MTAAAEYELLVGRRGSATQGADVLNVGHMVVILAIPPLATAISDAFTTIANHL